MVVMHAVSSLNMGGAERFVIDLSTVQRNQGLVPTLLSFGLEVVNLAEGSKPKVSSLKSVIVVVICEVIGAWVKFGFWVEK